MNIYALMGHKVRCTTLSAGYDSDQELAEKYLEIGKEYIVQNTDVNNWYTDVELTEFPNVLFNSVFFEDVVEQSEEDDKYHSDYLKYNSLCQ